MMTIGELGKLVKDLPADTPLAIVLDGKTMNGWIPVTERLPEDSIDVLICFENGVIFMAHRYTIQINNRLFGGWDDGSGWWESDLEPEYCPTAWMPLPEPYKENANDSV